MITLKDVQIDALNLYYSEELIELKAEAVRLAEKMHAASDYTAAAEYSTIAGKISDELTARGDTPAAPSWRPGPSMTRPSRHTTPTAPPWNWPSPDSAPP